MTDYKIVPMWRRIGIAFLGGQAVSILGSSLVQFAIIWYVTLSANSGTSMMIITLASFIPQLIVAPFAGVWADRYDRRWLIMLADLGIALVTAGLMVMFILGRSHVWLIYIVSAIRSLGGGIQGPAITALIPQITPKEHLVRVNGIYSTINNVLMLLSPILGGALIMLFPIWSVFLVDILTAAAAISIMFFIPIPHQKTGKILTALGHTPTLKPGQYWGFPTEFGAEGTESAIVTEGAVGTESSSGQKTGADVLSVDAAAPVESPHTGNPQKKNPAFRSKEAEAVRSGITEFREGFRYVGKNAPLRNMMITYALFMILLSPIAILVPLFIRRHFGTEVWRITATQTALFAGMAIGGLIVSIKGQFKSRLMTIRASGFLVAAVTLCVAILGITKSPLFAVFAALAFLLGNIVPFYSTAVTTLFQEKVERDYHGRVFSLLYMIGSAAIPLGTVLFGPLADTVAIEKLLFLTSILQMILIATTLKTVPTSFEHQAAADTDTREELNETTRIETAAIQNVETDTNAAQK